jgi:RNA polymerase sigma-70 factor, ECF subfamily
MLVDTEQFARMYDIHYPRVFHYLLGRTRNPHDAEELAADVFATALESLTLGAVPRQTGSWLVGIADHLASRFFRERRTTEADAPVVDLTEERDPEELALGRLERQTVWQCIAGLSPEHRQVLLLRVVAGLSAREVGEVLGKTEEAIRVLQFRALRALRKNWMEAERDHGRSQTTYP